MILVLVAVIACIYGIVFLLKKGINPVQKTDPYLKKVATLSVSPGKFVYVITLNSHAYLIGVTDASVNLIGEIEDKELIDAMNLHAESESSDTKPKDFASLLNLFKPSKNGKSVSFTDSETVSRPFSGSTETASRLLRQQRERLQQTSTSFPEDGE